MDFNGSRKNNPTESIEEPAALGVLCLREVVFLEEFENAMLVFLDPPVIEEAKGVGIVNLIFLPSNFDALVVE